MNQTSRLELRVGLLVIAGLVALVVTIFASDKVSFEGTYNVTVFMGDAGNLRVGSPVRLSGLKVGSVSRIQTSDDARGSVRVDVAISQSVVLYRTSELTLATDGILGDSHLAFGAPGEPRGEALPRDGTASVVASATFLSQAADRIDRLLVAFEDLTDDSTRRDVKRLIAGAADLAQESSLLVTEVRGLRERIDSSLAQVDALLVQFGQDGSAVGAAVSETLVEARETMQGVRLQIDRLAPIYEQVGLKAESALDGVASLARRSDVLLESEEAVIRGLLGDLAATAGEARALVTDVRGGRGVIGQLLTSEALAADVHQTTVGTAQLIERVSRDPQIMVWGPGEDENDRARRRREEQLMRRAFMEGYRLPPGRTLEQPRGNLAAPADDD